MVNVTDINDMTTTMKNLLSDLELVSFPNAMVDFSTSSSVGRGC